MGSSPTVLVQIQAAQASYFTSPCLSFLICNTGIGSGLFLRGFGTAGACSSVTTLPIPPPPLQKQTPKDLISEATAISGQHWRRGTSGQSWNIQEWLSGWAPGTSAFSEYSSRVEGPPSPFPPPHAFLLPHSHASQVPRDCQRADCWKPTVPTQGRCEECTF